MCKGNAHMCLAGIRKDKTPKSSVFGRLREGKQPKPSVFAIINIGGKSSSLLPAQDKNSMLSYLGEVNEVQSFIPSCIKHISTLDVNTDASLIVKRQILGIINCEGSSNSKRKIKEEKHAFYKHIMVREADDLEAEVKPVKVPETLKDGKASSVAKQMASP